MSEGSGRTEFDPRVLRGIWLRHRDRAAKGLEASRRLLEHDEPGPAFVWAARAVEIFVRECLLFPHYYERLGDERAAYNKASRKFGSGNWVSALAIATAAYGPLDDPLTDSDEDAWRHWKRVAVQLRGEVVHGRTDASAEEAEWVVGYAERFLSWWTQRLAVYDRGPLRGVLREIIEAARQSIGDADSASTPKSEDVAGGEDGPPDATED
jgi:hypothetical protein